MKVEILSDDVTVGDTLMAKNDVVEVTPTAANFLESTGKARVYKPDEGKTSTSKKARTKNKPRKGK